MKNVTFEFGLNDKVFYMSCNRIVRGSIIGAEVTENLTLYKIKKEINGDTIRVKGDYLFAEIEQLLNNLKYKYENPSKTD